MDGSTASKRYAAVPAEVIEVIDSLFACSETPEHFHIAAVRGGVSPKHHTLCQELYGVNSSKRKWSYRLRCIERLLSRNVFGATRPRPEHLSVRLAIQYLEMTTD